MRKSIYEAIAKFKLLHYLNTVTKSGANSQCQGQNYRRSFFGVPGVSFAAFIALIATVKPKILANFIIPLVAGLFPAIAVCQSIIPDGTANTTLAPGGDITGGISSQDGKNLFHSFSEFGLNQGEVANFMSNPSIVNILGRVTGGNPSIINGLIKVTGGNSHLFLMNPAGMVFGANSSLNLPGDFTATTATRIGFGNENWFNGIGGNNYAALVGSPSLFDFGLSGTPGTIINGGNLGVGAGKSLNLIGGTVVNTGSLTARGGNISMVAVPGENLVRISQAGNLLSLEIQASKITDGGLPNPLSLPELLTGSPQMETLTGLRVNSSTGEVNQIGSNLIVPEVGGTVFASGKIDVSTISPLGGGVQLWGNSIGFFGDILASGISGNSLVELSAKDNLTFAGNVDTSSLFGDKGKLLLKSSNFTIIDSAIINGDTTANQPPSPFDPNSPTNTLAWGNIANLISKNKITLQGIGDITVTDIIGNTPKVTQNDLVKLGRNIGSLTLESTQGAIAFVDPKDTIQGSDITLQAFQGINAGNFLTNGGAITLTSQTDSITAGKLDTSAIDKDGGSVSLNAQTGIDIDYINSQSFNGRGGNVDIATGRFFRASDTFAQRNGNNFSISTAGKAGGGSLIIRHGVNTASIPFTVGSDYNRLNGTAGGISTGADNGISPIQNNEILNGIFSGYYRQGNSPSDIQIIGPKIDKVALNNPIPEVNTPISTPNNDKPKENIVPITIIPPGEIDTVVEQIEESFTTEFEDYLGKDIQTARVNLSQAQGIIADTQISNQMETAIIYAIFVPKTFQMGTTTKQPSDELELVAVTAKGKPIRKHLIGVNREKVFKVAQEFRSGVTNVRNQDGYLNSSQQLYQWIIAPLAEDLAAGGVKNLVFILDSGLRSLPIAALHDGKRFLIEKYSISLMPSLSLTDTSYRNINNAQVLAMGADTFSEQKPLPAVPIELGAIAGKIWKGKYFLNNAFTLENLKAQRQETPFGIIHLATHANFLPGQPSESYIQLWNSKLRLDQIRQLGWHNPPVELLVLSACRTALGDEEAELGFAGLAVQAGVKSALASLWYVSDEGTLGLMTEFYQELKISSIKAEALRQAQLAMLRGEVQIESGKLRSGGEEIILPPELVRVGNLQLTHPYYWAAFTMIGSP
ncbi:MAG TPA: hypothetical protein DD000_19380 [Cyanobacteria bacterium UBA11166]|nr:hypothetical protein [Cyanobacteria bacterium UBA11166]